MTLHFAYGSNMSRAHMRGLCPGASALGVATLVGWQFTINPDGYGSIERRPGGKVLGALWRLTPRDVAAVDAYEHVAAGLYDRRILAVRRGTRREFALVYIARRRGRGTPRPDYIALVVAGARDWQLPERYVQSLQRWSPSARPGAWREGPRDAHG
ncbi:MAG: gamma-glutamylcyclotransferase family protein [Xanthobacteraceae bacterium]